MAYYFKYQSNPNAPTEYLAMNYQPMQASPYFNDTTAVRDEYGNYAPSMEPDPRYQSISQSDYFAAQDFLKGTSSNSPTSDFYVDPNIGVGQPTLAELIKKRGAYIEQTSAPYRQALFKGMSFGNPNLESDYFKAAIPQIQQSYKQAADITGRTAGATGVDISGVEQKLANRLSLLGQEQTIADAAKTIKQRLKERDLSTALGVSGATNEVMQGAY